MMVFHNKWLKCCLWGLPVFLLLFLGAETFLRIRYGLCDAVLMREDPDYEYIAQPNQKRHRLGNDIFYNSLSMRSEELRPEAIKILCVGDSVINGGTLTDQSRLATTLLEQKLKQQCKKDIQVLNISAGSWGPDNCAAYLHKHGTFGAVVIILVCSSHDARDTMNFISVVGRHRSYPEKQYSLAIIELLDRYLYPGLLTHTPSYASFEQRHHISKNGKIFNSGFHELMSIAQKQKMAFAVILHAELSEVKEKQFNPMGQEILHFMEEQHIPYLTDLQTQTPDCFRPNDIIHPSDKGQQQLAEMFLQILMLLQKQGTALE